MSRTMTATYAGPPDENPTATELAVDEIVDAIQRLTPAGRRQLQLRLRVTGLMPPETNITDQDRLRVAPALPGRSQMLTRAEPAPDSHPAPVADEPGQQSGRASALKLTPAGVEIPNRSPISGKVVVGEPGNRPNVDDPHAMAPLPGQAPEQPIEIIFDGGSKGNPGEGYGSYALHWPGSQPQVVRLRFGNQVTNNEAEYDTLIAALDGVLKRLQDQGADPKTARLDIRGDSLLVINQVLGQWKTKEARLEERRDRVRALLQRFGRWRLRHHDRKHSVTALGH